MTNIDFKSFRAQPLDYKNQRRQKMFRLLFGWMTVILILPVLVILTLLTMKGAPVFTQSRVLVEVEFPTEQMFEVRDSVLSPIEEVMEGIDGLGRKFSDYGPSTDLRGWGEVTLVGPVPTPATVMGTSTETFEIPAGEVWSMNLAVDGGDSQEVQFTAAPEISMGDVAAALDALEGVSAKLNDGRIEIKSESVGGDASVQALPGELNRDLAAVCGFTEGLATGTDRTVDDFIEEVRTRLDGDAQGGGWNRPEWCGAPTVELVSLWERTLEFFSRKPTQNMTEGGIFPCLMGTLWIVAVALLASLPLGVAAAVYLSEYAPDNFLTRLINLAIINLAGVPSIVHALFGVGAFVMFFNIGTSILAAGLTLAVMTLPVVIVSTRESLQAVPHAFREACWSLGATRSQTIRKVVLPNSISGILTGIILEVSRTVGETAPIMFTGAALFLPFVPDVSTWDGVVERLGSQTMAMSLHLFTVSTQVPEVPVELPFGVALVLIGMVLVLNSVSIAFRMYLRGQKKW